MKTTWVVLAASGPFSSLSSHVVMCCGLCLLVAMIVVSETKGCELSMKSHLPMTSRRVVTSGAVGMVLR